MALHWLAEQAFDDLLHRWRWHDDLRAARSTASVRVMADSLAELEVSRTRMRRLREALYPTVQELDQALHHALCPTLDEVVSLSERHRDPNKPGCLRCPCGDLIEIANALDSGSDGQVPCG